MGMDWLNIAGGAGKGYVEGSEDNRRREEFNTLQRQRLRVEKQQKDEDALTETLKQVQPAGDYDQVERTGVAVGPAETQPGFAGPGSGTATKRVRRSGADVEREQANIIGKSGKLDNITRAAQMRASALQSEDAERRENTAKKFEVLGQAETMLAEGNHAGAYRRFQEGYNKLHKDGYNMVEEMKDGVLHSGVVDRDGNYVQPLQPVTPETVKKLINTGYSVLSPEARAAERKNVLDEKTLGIHERTAQAQELTAKAAADKVAYDTTGPGGQAHLDYLKSQGIYLDRHGRSMLMQAQASVANNKKLSPAEKAKELTDFYTPLLMQANPGMSEVEARKQAASVAMRDPNAKAAPDTGLTEQGIFRVNGKLYKTGKDGQPEEYLLPDDITNLATNIGKNLPPKGAAAAGGAAAAPPGLPDTDGSVAAQKRVGDAEKALQRYGLRQRKDDPTGYAKANSRLAEAQAELDALNAKYATTQPTGAAFSPARP